LRYKLSFRDLVEMMAERGLPVAHTTIMRWIQRYVPEFEKRWNRFARPAGRSWRVDETYVKIKGRWTYLYRAVDKEGKTVDFLLRANRDVAAAKAFFRRAFRHQGRLPRKITLDGYQASHRAAREILDEHRHGARTPIRSSKYLT
jgi:transposase-like protein